MSIQKYTREFHAHSTRAHLTQGERSNSASQPQARRAFNGRASLALKWLVALLLAVTVNLAAAVDINSASAEQIAQSLKGVGLKKAQAIVAYRQKAGRFKTVDDLLNVKGVGKKLLDLNAANITLSSAGNNKVGKK